MGSTFGQLYKTDYNYYVQVSNLHVKIVVTPVANKGNAHLQFSCYSGFKKDSSGFLFWVWQTKSANSKISLLLIPICVLTWCDANLFLPHTPCDRYKTIKRLMNYYKQTIEEGTPAICSLYFSQFPFNLTHAFVLSLKAPFPQMASLLSFTRWQHKEEAFCSLMQLPKVRCWKYMYTPLNLACVGD